MTTNQHILAIVAERGLDRARELVAQWCNSSEIDIDNDGDIWIANPQTGHWLNEERKAEFVGWCAQQ